MRVGVVTFPGTLDDRDAARAVRAGGSEAVELWHGDADLKNVDAVILPGGFSYGDYLRCGAISRFAPVMTLIIEQANKGMPLLGICNGFQVLCESHLLPGALTRNSDLHFLCKDQVISIENTNTPWTSSFPKVKKYLFHSKMVKVLSNVMMQLSLHLKEKRESLPAMLVKIQMDHVI